MQLDLEEQIIIFQVFGQSYAFYFKEVKEVIERGLFSFTPKAPSFFQGIMNHQESVILVISPRKLLQLPSPGENGLPRIFLISGPETKIGFFSGSGRE